MAFINADRIKETTTTTGTGAITLAGAVLGFRAFSSVMAIGDTCTYSVVSDTLTESEAGIGTYSALNTLTRTTVQSSSNANAAVVFTAGVKNVFIGPIAGTQIPYDPVTGALNLSVNALNDVAITSPTVNQVLKYSGTEWTNQADAVNVGTVTIVSVASANGFGGTVATATSTPAITLTTSITGVLKGDASAILAAVAGTDYVTPAGSVAYATGAGNAATVTTNANLTGPVTSTGNATAIADGALSIAKTSGLQVALDARQPLDAALTALAAGSDFVQFVGPATATKVFTLPDASSTLLVSGGALGTPISGVMTNVTGTASGLTSGNVTTNANLTGHITSVGNAAVLGSFTSAQLAGALSDETGTGAAVFATSPTLVTPLTNSLSAVTVASGLTASVTAATGASGIITYTAANTFTVGRTVSVTGLGVSSGTTLNIAGMTIATASSTQFTVVNATVGVSSGTGTATAGGNTLAVSASNAVTAGPGGNYTIAAGSGVGVGKGGDIELRLSSEGSSGGNGGFSIFHPSGKLSNRFTTNNVDPNLYMTGNLDVGSFNSNSYATASSFETFFVRLNNSSYNAPTAIIIANTGRIDWSSNSTTGTNLGDTAIGRAAAGVLKISLGVVSTTTGGSLSFPSTTEAIAANTNDRALTASAFQRINCTAPSNLTGIAPPTGGTHVDGRMIRVYNVGTANLTLTHNSGLSTTANRFWNSTAADIVLATNDYAELIYDSTSNGSGAAGWRVS